MTPQEIRSVAKANGTNIAIVGNRVYEANRYAPEIVQFTSQKFLLLNHHYAGLTLQECADKTGISVEDAELFLETPKAQEWLRKRAVRDYIQKEYQQGKWYELADDCVEGRRQLRKDQQVAFSALGERFAPKPKTHEDAKTVINFNFSAKDVEEAFKRQASIDAELA